MVTLDTAIEFTVKINLFSLLVSEIHENKETKFL